MKLTSREKEIAEFLQKEPLISQDELAMHFGISRSSVAVHISNLMKKGIILGKGYVFNKKVSIVIIGQVYIEISVNDEPENTKIDINSNGFGLNVAKSLADFGLKPKLITLIGNDGQGDQIINELKAAEVDISHIYRHAEKRTCKKIVSNQDLNLIEGYNDRDFQQAIEARDWIAANCDWLIVEADLQQFMNAKISRGDNIPCQCGCYYVNKKIPSYLNRYQLLVLGAEDLNNYDYYEKEMYKMMMGDTQNCIITDGNSSMIVLNDQGITDYPIPPNQSFDCGTDLHLFLTGLVFALSAGYPMRQALRMACGTACGGRNSL